MTNFFIGEYKFDHPTHGRFYVSRLLRDSSWEVSRTFGAPGELCTVERLTPWGEPRTLAQAKRVVAKRIAELDAEAAQKVAS